uniref:Uncharacterized protein n=1 Tax=Anguilla anguilla TaxID=7936 RepID=A0A0E9WYT2_ANGAN
MGNAFFFFFFLFHPIHFCVLFRFSFPGFGRREERLMVGRSPLVPRLVTDKVTDECSRKKRLSLTDLTKTCSQLKKWAVKSSRVMSVCL